jgi:ABC-type glycerol-3-phosphate transport system substrate-binding protein
MDTYYAYNGVNPEVGKLLPFVFQRNTDIYNEDGTASTLDSPECIAAFKELTDLHIKYKFPIEDPTYTTFADGRTPIQIAQNWYYPGFEQTSPQLKGKWDLALFPGSKQKDGTINRINTGKSLVWSIVSTTKKKEAAWKLIQYLSSDEFTQRFANSVYDRLKVRLFYSNNKYLVKAPFPKNRFL